VGFSDCDHRRDAAALITSGHSHFKTDHARHVVLHTAEPDATATSPGWTTHAALLRPLVASGQIQLGNHTWDHANLTKLSDGQVVAELQRNHDFISNTYGADARPYYRPPFGFHNARVNRVAASIGYTTPVMWYGSLSDSALLVPDKVVTFADQWFLPGRIVIGHANFLPVTTVFPQLSAIIHGRGLQTVTVNDVFIRP
jgi:peptidoglycan/xylan/chitin deacetylase (PgdA/CDA1 family)